jgi:anti-sigma regulatory factor (Ser/Thr protein kinase)
MDKTFISYHIAERSYVAYIKREIHNKVTQAKFTETKAAEIDIIVSEIASNLVKHVGSGELLYRIQNISATESTFEIISIDNGPGMSDTSRMMRDGVSTSSTLGHGLGAISRLSDAFQIFSMPAWGTVVYSMVKTKGEKKANSKPFDLEIRALCVNKPREIVCGDGFRIKRTASAITIFFGDGLGHGPNAKDAVDAAGDFFMECMDTEPVLLIRQLHEKVRKTRGLVATVASFNKNTNEWSLCGVGNILTRIYSGITYKNYLPYNGTVGLNLPNSMKPSVFPVEKNQHLIMCSDGIQTRWDLNRYPAIFKYDNIVLAATLYKDFSRGTDDSSTLIAKVI